MNVKQTFRFLLRKVASEPKLNVVTNRNPTIGFDTYAYWFVRGIIIVQLKQCVRRGVSYIDPDTQIGVTMHVATLSNPVTP